MCGGTGGLGSTCDLCKGYGLVAPAIAKSYNLRITARKARVMDRVRLWDKANALAAACVAHGMPPTLARVALLYAVAEHETRCGDAWPGEHNWGATTRRSLTAAESSRLRSAGIFPVLSPSAVRVAAETAAAKCLGLTTESDVAIHTDSRPVIDHMTVPFGHRAGVFGAMFHAANRAADRVGATLVYFTMFARFADDTAGAMYFVGFFRTSAERKALEGQSIEPLARAMYEAHYYTGFLAGDPEGNIVAYSRACAPLYTAALTGLQGWTPGADAPHVSEPADPAIPLTGKALQRALNAAGAWPQLVVDGIVGPKTAGALRVYQAAYGGAYPPAVP